MTSVLLSENNMKYAPKLSCVKPQTVFFLFSQDIKQNLVYRQLQQ